MYFLLSLLYFKVGKFFSFFMSKLSYYLMMMYVYSYFFPVRFFSPVFLIISLLFFYTTFETFSINDGKELLVEGFNHQIKELKVQIEDLKHSLCALAESVKNGKQDLSSEIDLALKKLEFNSPSDVKIKILIEQQPEMNKLPSVPLDPEIEKTIPNRPSSDNILSNPWLPVVIAITVFLATILGGNGPDIG